MSCAIFRTRPGGAVVVFEGCNIGDPWSKRPSFSWTLPRVMLTALKEMFSPTISADGRTLIPRETQTSPRHRRSGSGIGLRLPFVLDPEGLLRAARRAPQRRGGATWASDGRAPEEDPESGDVLRKAATEFFSSSWTPLRRSVTAGIAVGGAVGCIGWWRGANALLTFQVKGKLAVAWMRYCGKLKSPLNDRVKFLHKTCLRIKSHNLLQNRARNALNIVAWVPMQKDLGC